MCYTVGSTSDTLIFKWKNRIPEVKIDNQGLASILDWPPIPPSILGDGLTFLQGEETPKFCPPLSMLPSGFIFRSSTLICTFVIYCLNFFVLREFLLKFQERHTRILLWKKMYLGQYLSN